MTLRLVDEQADDDGDDDDDDDDCQSDESHSIFHSSTIFNLHTRIFT